MYTSLSLKGQVTFLKLCLLVVCLALIIPRFTLFGLTTVFRPKNAYICLYQRSLFYIFHVYLVANPRRKLEFKMVVTVRLYDISSMYIYNSGTSYVFILYVFFYLAD